MGFAAQEERQERRPRPWGRERRGSPARSSWFAAGVQMLVGSFSDLLTSGSAAATAWQETSPTEGLDGSGSPEPHLPPRGTVWIHLHPWMSDLEEGAGLILPARAWGQRAEPPRKMLPESCGHQDDGSRLVPALVPSPAPRGDSEGHHGGHRARSSSLQNLPGLSLPLPPHPGWAFGGPSRLPPLRDCSDTHQHPKIHPFPSGHLATSPLHPSWLLLGTKWDSWVGAATLPTGSPPDLPPPHSCWANPCPHRCR